MVMAHRNRWFTELKNGDFPWRTVSHNQMVYIIYIYIYIYIYIIYIIYIYIYIYICITCISNQAMDIQRDKLIVRCGKPTSRSHTYPKNWGKPTYSPHVPDIYI